MDCANEAAARAVSDFDKHEHLVIEHDEVDFAVPASKVAADR